MKLLVSVGISFFLLFNFSDTVKAQSMRDLFLSLPSFCTPGLNNSGRKSLIKDTEYTVKARKEEDEIDYTIDTVSDIYMAYEYSNSKGQGTNENYEIKKFVSNDGRAFIMFSKTGDPRIHSNKYILKAYNISGTNLIANEDNFIPENLDFRVFIKFETPDSVRTSLERTSYYTFDLDQRSNDKVIFRIMLQSDKDEKWLTGNTMIFKWTGKMFTSSIIFQKEE
jgi:hypothetical protein